MLSAAPAYAAFGTHNYMFNCRGTEFASQPIACKREIVKAPMGDDARVTPRAVKQSEGLPRRRSPCKLWQALEVIMSLRPSAPIIITRALMTNATIPVLK